MRNLPFERDIESDDNNKKPSLMGIVLIILLILVGITLIWYFLRR